MAERVGFEPTVKLLNPTHDFQSCTFGLSVISPLSLSKIKMMCTNQTQL